MKIIIVFIFIISPLLSQDSGIGEINSRDQLVNQRLSIAWKMVSLTEERMSRRIVGEDEVDNKRLIALNLELEYSSLKAKKIEFINKIIEIYEKKKTAIQKRIETGFGDKIDLDVIDDVILKYKIMLFDSMAQVK